MDFLNRALAQINELFRSMTPGARITTGLLLAVIVISLAYLFNHQGSSADDMLFAGESIPSSQVPAVEAAFGKAKLSGYVIDSSHRIHVPGSQKAAYLAALADNNALPKIPGDQKILALRNSGPFASNFQTREMLKIAQERELAEIIRSMHGIESAAVMYDVQTESGWHDKPTVKTASVSVKPQGSEPLEDERVRSIRQLVAGALGCKPTDVSVVDLNTDRTFAAGSAGGGGALDDKYAAAKRMYEKEWQDKIRDALSYVSMVKVACNVELNPEIDTQKESTSVDPKAVPVISFEKSSTQENNSTPVGGQPGAQANGVANRPVSISSGAAQKNSQEVTENRQNNVYGTSKTTQTVAGLTPKRVSVTIGVPSNYYEKIWQERNPAPAGSPAKTPDPQQLAQIETTESKKIHEFVVQLLPREFIPDKVDPAQLVQVTTFQHITSAPIAAPSIPEQTLYWLSQYWSTLGMVALGAASLWMLRSMTKAIPASAPAAESTVNEIVGGEEDILTPSGTPAQQEAAARLKRRSKSGPSLRDELVEIVREDPDAAANILRNWIGTAT